MINFYQGVWSSNAKDRDAAITSFTKAILLKPNFAGAYYSRGQIYFAKGDTDKAIRDFTKAILLQLKFVEAYFSRGNA